MANFKKNGEGVSAVIGVILMVAITVILAAVIAAFVFQLGNQMPTTGHTVGVQVTRISDQVISVKTLSGDADLLKVGAVSMPTYNVTANGVAAAWCDYNGGAATNYDAHAIGGTLYFIVPANTDITVVANYQDGSTSTPYSGKIT